MTSYLTLPPHWTPLPARSKGVLARARSRPTGRDSTAEIELAINPPFTATDHVIEDEDSYLIAGFEATYVRSSARDGDLDLIHEEWTWQIDGVAWRLLATIPWSDYESFCDDVEEIAESFTPAAWRDSA